MVTRKILMVCGVREIMQHGTTKNCLRAKRPTNQELQISANTISKSTTGYLILVA
jgi:hypothetical protein